MCGIVGAIGYLDKNILESVKKMNKVQSHRGPDSHGFWTSIDIEKGYGSALGHRRLAVIDLNKDANQPMIDTLTGNTVVFNGEIYNYLELKSELESLGVMFRSHSDTEVVLLAYRQWGSDFVNRLRGMFAIAFYDKGIFYLMN